MFVGVEFRDIYVDKAHRWILKRSLRSAGEVGVARTDAQDQVRLSRHDVRAGRARHSHGAELLGMVVRQRTFTCLRLAYRNSRRLCKVRESFPSLRIENTSAGHNQRFLRASNPSNGTLHQFLIAAIARDPPNPFLEKLFGEIECFRLHILRESDRNSSRIRGRGQYAHCFRK